MSSDPPRRARLQISSNSWINCTISTQTTDEVFTVRFCTRQCRGTTNAIVTRTDHSNVESVWPPDIAQERRMLTTRKLRDVVKDTSSLRLDFANIAVAHLDRLPPEVESVSVFPLLQSTSVPLADTSCRDLSDHVNLSSVEAKPFKAGTFEFHKYVTVTSRGVFNRPVLPPNGAATVIQCIRGRRLVFLKLFSCAQPGDYNADWKTLPWKSFVMKAGDKLSVNHSTC